jgi:DNA polymerase III sliding clamp (beta) subunit (PCNA family)
VVKAGRSRFTLSTLPANDFPTVEEGPGSLTCSLEQSKLRRLIERTSFAMAQQDVRYYLNGMLLEVSTDTLRAWPPTVTVWPCARCRRRSAGRSPPGHRAAQRYP